MIAMQQQGLVKSIGVCNFNQPHLKRLLEETGVTPVINQIELHPMLQQRTLHAWNAMHQIQTESWSPLAQGGEGVFDQEIIKSLAKNTVRRRRKSLSAGIWTAGWWLSRNPSRRHASKKTSMCSISAWIRQK